MLFCPLHTNSSFLRCWIFVFSLVTILKKTVIEQNQVLETKAQKPSVQLALRKFTLMVQGSSLKASTCSQWLTSVPSHTPWLASMPSYIPLPWTDLLITSSLCAVLFFYLHKSVHVDVRGQLKGTICVPLLCRSWRLSSGHRALRQVSFPLSHLTGPTLCCMKDSDGCKLCLWSRERAGRENPRHPQLRLEHKSGDSCTTEGHTARSGIALPEEWALTVCEFYQCSH